MNCAYHERRECKGPCRENKNPSNYDGASSICKKCEKARPRPNLKLATQIAVAEFDAFSQMVRKAAGA